MLSIHLHNVILFAYHGLYEHEQINGNNFEVNITVNYRPKQMVNDIEHTINYVEVYNLLNNRMQIATPLLETLVMDIAAQILAQFQLAEAVFISIKKLQPPIDDFNGSVGVSYSLKKSEL
jgi:7,8-dihydroneopterin aldolase/epimerase/oxygenase